MVPPLQAASGAQERRLQALSGAELPVHSMSVKDIEREILSLSDTYPPTSRAGGMAGGGMLLPGAEASTLQRQMSGGAAAPDADMMIRGGGMTGERVAASPQSNGSKNFTKKLQVPRIDLGGIGFGAEAPLAAGEPGASFGGISAPIQVQVETGSSYAESEGSDDEAQLVGQVSQLKLPDSPVRADDSPLLQPQRRVQGCQGCV